MAPKTPLLPPLTTVPQTLLVPWISGNEVLNLDEIKGKLKSLTLSATVQTTEHRTDGRRDVVYQPLLTQLPKGFTLTYTDEGNWLDDHGGLQKADGLTGRAQYIEQLIEGKAKWSCTWFGDDKADDSIPFECHLSNTTRESTSVKRAVRDAKFRNIIFGPKPTCLITGETLKSVLEAAHIYEVKHEGTDTIDNGFVMRSDIHKLFDSHILTVSSEGKFTIHTVPESYKYLFEEDEKTWKRGQPTIDPTLIGTYVENIRRRNEKRLKSQS